MTSNTEFHPAINIATNEEVYPQDAHKIEEYKCIQCEEPVVLCKGNKVPPYFRHKHKCNCSYYTNESPEHLEAKHLLQELLTINKSTITIRRKCKSCMDWFEWEIDPLDDSYRVQTEFEFTYNNIQRKADIACIDQNNELIFIIEICNTHKTSPEVRPEPWFELSAEQVRNSLIAVDYDHIDKETKFTFDCIRSTFCKENESLGLCPKCEETEKGVIYCNQRGAGCGKTYESIQLINSAMFENKSHYIYLTKMHSAVNVIYNEFQDQFAKGKLGANIKIISDEVLSKHYRLTLQKTNIHDGTTKIIKILIGTIDSFYWAICNNKVLRGSNAFHQLVLDIRNGNVSIGFDGTIAFARTRPKLNRECLVIVDEAQDLTHESLGAMETIIDHTAIDVYLIGDKLQSILSETNLFTKIYTMQSTDRLIKDDGDNIVKRFHNRQFIPFVNDLIQFEKYELKPVTAICDGTSCHYHHENDVQPYVLDNGFGNIYKIDEEQMHGRIECILNDMRNKILKHGYLPNNFCFILPVVNEKNQILSLLYPALENFWIDYFSDPTSYTPYLIDNMRKQYDFWETKIKLQENDTNKYKYVVLHRSEDNKPINLDESEDATRIMSIHASKGTGRECVYLLGLSEMTLTCHTGGLQNIIYESLLHVAITRQKMYLYVGYDGTANDDICHRFSKYSHENSVTEPYIANIRGFIGIHSIARECTNTSPRLGMNSYWDQFNHIIDFSKSHIDQYLNKSDGNHKIIDWGHHIIRYSLLRTNIEKYFFENVDMSEQQFYAKYKTLVDPKTTVVYCLYKEYKRRVYELNKAIEHNCTNYDKIKMGTAQKLNLVIPILVFSPTNAKNDFAKYHSMVKASVENVRSKLQKKQYDFCPIETVLYVYLSEMIQKPYKCKVSIVDIYHIIYDYDDCLTNHETHSERFQCCCSKHISPKPSSHHKSNDAITKSIVNHYEAMEYVKQIMVSYNTMVQSLIGEKKIKYNIDKIIPLYDGIGIHADVPYLGIADNIFITFVLAPHLSELNIYDILTEILFTQYIIKLKHRDAVSLILKTCIITLDSNTPIFVDMSEILETKLEEINTVLKDILKTHFETNHVHQRIFDYIEYYRRNISQGSYLKPILEKIKDNKNIYRSFPEYIINWIKDTDDKIGTETNTNIKINLKNNLKSIDWVVNELDNKLDNRINDLLGIQCGDW
jgi:Competence protein CoiA-like family